MNIFIVKQCGLHFESLLISMVGCGGVGMILLDLLSEARMQVQNSRWRRMIS